jgi:hypothetical protein
MRQPGLSDGDQLAFRADCLDVFCIGPLNEGGQPEVPALPDLTGGEQVDGRVGQLGQQTRSWDERFA